MIQRLLFLITLYACAYARGFAQTSDYEAFVQRGLTAAEHDSLEQAEEYFRQALRLSPADYRNALIFTNLGKILELRYWRSLESSPATAGSSPSSREQRRKQ